MENKTLYNIVKIARQNKGIDHSKGSIFNSWRARVYTKKGKLAGFPDSWKTFEGFLKDIPEGWEHGKVLVRKDPSLPFSKENCYWGEKGSETSSKLIKLTYNGCTKTIAEWCVEYNLNYNGVRQRYFKGKNYTIEEILFGKHIANSKTICSVETLSSEQRIKDKVSKMLSAYRCKDKKHGRTCDITNEYLRNVIENCPCVYCGDTHNVGLDRLDNTKGHTMDNVVPCCYECNVARDNNFTHEEMFEIGKAIKKIKERRNEDKCKKDCQEG